MDRLPFLVFCGAFLLHMACCTTVIPLCEPGESNENCTTAIVRKKTTRRAPRIQIVDCDEDKKDYCFFGTCQYIVDLGKMSCRCQKGYSGERCLYLEFVHQPMSEEYVALTAILSVLFIVAVAVGSFFIYKRYRKRLCKKKQQQPKKKYKEVTTCSV